MKRDKQLFISSLLFTICLIAWPIFIAVSQPQGEAVDAKFLWILQNQALFKVQFILAFLISPLLIYMMVSQLRHSKTEFGRAEVTGIMFLGGYTVLCSLSYGAQFVLVPRLIQQKLDVVALVTYFDSGVSVSYFLNQTGYLFWATGAIILFQRFLSQKGPVKPIAVIYMISAVLSIAAFIGLIIENKFLNSMTIVSGIVLLPVGIISMIQSFKPVSTR